MVTRPAAVWPELVVTRVSRSQQRPEDTANGAQSADNSPAASILVSVTPSSVTNMWRCEV